MSCSYKCMATLSALLRRMEFGTNGRIHITQSANLIFCAMWKAIPEELDSCAQVKCVIEFKNIADKAKEIMPLVPEHSLATTSLLAISSWSSRPLTEATTATSDFLSVVAGGGQRMRGQPVAGGLRLSKQRLLRNKPNHHDQHRPIHHTPHPTSQRRESRPGITRTSRQTRAFRR